MHTDTLIWLLLAVFMIHDFEEIIMMVPWLKKNTPELHRRFPRLAPRMLALTGNLSTPAFALAVGTIFLSLSIFTLLAVEFRLYALWGGLLVLMTVHFVIHFAQWVILRRYVPVIITTVISLVYCAYALWYVFNVWGFSWGDLLPGMLIATCIAAGVFYIATKTAGRFDRWLAAYEDR